MPELLASIDPDLLERIADEMPDGPFQRKYAGRLYHLSQKQRAAIFNSKRQPNGRATGGRQ
jgi:hypothetical protein